VHRTGHRTSEDSELEIVVEAGWWKRGAQPVIYVRAGCCR
jgi:hypothetical protein